ncbi:hypothetical protein ACQP2X_15910 [Actinoplanes sp. CA-131856]
MVFHYWHLAVLAGMVALIVWALRVARRPALAVLAALLVVVSGLLFSTLVLDEEFVEHSPADIALIGLPAVLGLGLGALALKRTGGPTR